MKVKLDIIKLILAKLTYEIKPTLAKLIMTKLIIAN